MGATFMGVVFSNPSSTSIPDNDPTGITSTITVSGLDPFLLKLNVQTFLPHTFPGDLDVTLTSPAGTVIKLTTDNGGTNDNVFNGTTWDDDADPGSTLPYAVAPLQVVDHTYVTNVLAPRLTPEGHLGAFIGEDPNGTWTLTVVDDSGIDVGSLNGWSLDLSAVLTPVVSSTSTFTQLTALAIPDNNTTGITSTVVVAGLGSRLFDLDLTTFIQHTFPGDLDITLTSPAGTVVTITTDNGSSNDNIFNGTVWDDSATEGVVDHTYTNLTPALSLSPEEALAAFVGEDPNGTWTLHVIDDSGVDTGTLDQWSLAIKTFTSNTSNSAPTNITLSNSAAAENSVNGTIVGALSDTDPDVGDTATFSLTNDAGGRFAVSGSNLVVANGSLLNFESTTSHSVTVRVTDSGGATLDKVFAIAVTDVYEAPIASSLSNSSVPENSANGTVVGALSATDPDAGDSVAFSLINNAGGRFALSGNNLVVANGGLLDFESSTSHSVTVRVTDSGGLTFEKVFNIEVTDAAETPHWTKSVLITPHPTGFLPAQIGDFNGDGTSDLAWFNGTTGSVDIWKLQDGGWVGSVDAGSHPTGYQSVGTGDFNHDGTSDLLWFNAVTRDVDVWKGGTLAGSVDIGAHPAGYQPVLAGDFTGDGTSDVLWFNPTTRDVDLWKISNDQWAASIDIGTHPAGYQPALAGDFNGDGTSDVAWYNSTTGEIDIWKISKAEWAGSVGVGPHPAGWQPLGAADFNHDGASDVVWYNPTNNNIDVWLMKNGQWSASVNIGSHPAGAVAVGVGDFDHNGVNDIMWRDIATGLIDSCMLALS